MRFPSSVHTHTTFCDGRDTPEAMARAAAEQGLTTLERIEAGDRPPEKPARSAAKPGYNVQHHDDALSDIQRAAIRRMLENGEE